MNVWVLNHYAGGPGLGRSHRHFCLSREWIRQGHAVTIFPASFHHLLKSSNAITQTISIEGVLFRPVSTPTYHGKSFGRAWNMLAYPRSFGAAADSAILDNGPPDIVIASSPHPGAWQCGMLLKRRFPTVRLIAEVRDIWPLSLTELMGVPGWNPIIWHYKRLERDAMSRADRIVSLLPGLDEYLSSRLRIDRKATWIPNGVDPHSEINPPEVSGLHEFLGSQRRSNRLILAYTGSIGPSDSLEQLVCAMRNDMGTSAVVLAGAGPSLESLMASFAMFGLTDRVFYCGSLAKDQTLGLLRLADAGYIGWHKNSIYRYGVSPNKLYDYMHAGLPVIHAIDSPHDLVHIASCGLSVSAEDPKALSKAIQILAAMSPESRNAMGQLGREWTLANADYAYLAQRYSNLFNGDSAS